jgi:HEAT repeat protein
MAEMRGRRIAIGGVAVALVLGLVGIIATRERLTQEWRIWKFERADGEERWVCAEVLERFDGRARELVEDWYIEQLDTIPRPEFERAFERLGEMKSERGAESVLLVLSEKMFGGDIGDDDVEAFRTQRLLPLMSRFGASAGPALLRQAEHPGEGMRAIVAAWASSARPVSSGSLRALARVYEQSTDSGFWSRSAIARGAEKLASTMGDEGLYDSDPELRLAWAELLGLFRLVQIREESVGPLRAMLRSDDSRARQAALRLLACVDELPFEVLTDLSPLLKPQSNPTTRHLASVVCTRIRPETHVSVGVLIESLDSENETLCTEACEALARLRLPPPRVTRALVRRLADLREPVAQAAENALIWIGPDSGILLTEALRDAPPRILYRVLRSLYEPEAVKASTVAPRLAMALADGSPEERLQAAYWLARFKERSHGATEALIRALRDESWEVRLHSVRALGYIGPTAKHAAPRMIEMEKNLDEKTTVRSCIDAALKSMGVRPDPAVE